jgi:hypothetical protein
MIIVGGYFICLNHIFQDIILFSTSVRDAHNTKLHVHTNLVPWLV